MPITRVFQNGNSQAVRLTKEFRFSEPEVVIKKVGDAVVLFPVRYSARAPAEALEGLDPEFRIERAQPEAAEQRDFGD